MLTFEQFVRDAAAKGEAVNLMFEERLFELVSVLHRITTALVTENIPHELIGGLAVLAHVEEADPTYATLTRDVDLMIRRTDLERVKEVAAHYGFRFRHTAGLDMLIYGPTESARNAVRLLFSGEKVRAAQAIENPVIAPERKLINGRDINVIPVVDLVKMKLSANRDKDRVHIRSMDAAGLITAEVSNALAPELQDRLSNIRATE